MCVIVSGVLVQEACLLTKLPTLTSIMMTSMNTGTTSRIKMIILSLCWYQRYWQDYKSDEDDDKL